MSCGLVELLGKKCKFNIANTPLGCDWIRVSCVTIEEIDPPMIKVSSCENVELSAWVNLAIIETIHVCVPSAEG